MSPEYLTQSASQTPEQQKINKQIKEEKKKRHKQIK